MIRKTLCAAALLALASLPAGAQSNPGLVQGQVPTAAQWNSYFSAKQNVLGYSPVNRAGDSMTGRLITFTPTTAGAGFNLPHGAAPTIPVNGDMWTTTADLFVRINGVTKNVTSTAYSAGTGLTLSGTAFSITNTTVTAASYGSATASPTFTVNARGQLTTAANVTITPALGSITGLGTNVAAALAVNVGAAGAFSVNKGVTTVTANYTILTSDCGKTVQAGTGSTGLFTLTLPSISGFEATCRVTIVNGDTGRGKVLTGFPGDFTAGSNILWPSQSGAVQIVNGAWATYINPGIYQAPGALTLNVNHSTGSDSASDCLGTGAGACATIYHAFKLFQTRVKAGLGGPAKIQSDCGFTETPPAAFLGPLLTDNGVALILGDPASPSTCSWTTAGIVVDDGAVVSLSGFKAINAGSSQTWLSVAKGGIGLFDNMHWSTATGGIHMAVAEAGTVVKEGGGTYQVGDAGCAPNCMSYHMINNGGTIELGGVTINIPSALTFTAWYAGAGSGSNANWAANTYSGAGATTSTGALYQISHNAVLRLNAGNALVGSAASQNISLGACVDSLCVPGSRGLFSAISGTCTAPFVGAIAHVSDSMTAVWGATITGGGGNPVLAYCNGTNWTVAGK